MKATRPAPLPFVALNLAVSADGKINTANRRVSSFSSSRDREHMLELRATVDAVMSGARTVDLHPVTMGTGSAKYRRLRLRRRLAEHHLRIVVSGSASLNPEAEIFKRPSSSPLIILTTRRASARRLRALRPLANELKAFGDAEVDFRAALRWLREKWKVKRLLCEGGGELNEAFFRAGLVDEIHLTLCPCIFGGRTAPTLADGPGLGRLANAAGFRLKSARRRGDELFLVYCRTRSGQKQIRSRPARGADAPG